MIFFNLILILQRVQEPRLAFDWLATSASLPVAVHEIYRVESHQNDDQRLKSDGDGDTEPVFRRILLTVSC